MDKPISVGDLVQVVLWPCCGWKLGYVATVSDFVDSSTAACHNCLAPGPHATYARLSPMGDAPIEWLKRIPPLDELEGLESEEVDKLPTQKMIDAAKRYKLMVTSK